MKRAIAWMAAILLVLTAYGSALAETPLRIMYDSAFNLLFDTNNVTLTGHAEFFLDGQRFKTADAKYIQDGTNSLWEWKLLTPRKDGTEREGGYTVIANDEKIYVMEVFYPGVYKTGTNAASDTIMRKSVQLNLLCDFLRSMADQSESLLGENAVRLIRDDDSGTEIRIQAGSDVPELVNTALNMAAQFVAKRYFETDYDYVSESYMGFMGDYITVTQGILGSTYYMALREADITFIKDADGHPESVDGSLSIILKTKYDGDKVLDISFRLNASDWGTSRVGDFNPEDYGVKLAEGYVDLREPETESMDPEINSMDPEIKSMDPETEARFVEAAKTVFQLAGYTVDEAMKGSAWIESNPADYEGERIRFDFVNEDESAHWFFFTDSIGRILGLQNLTGAWQNTYGDRQAGPYPDQKLAEETEERLLSWLAETNPELSADVLSLETDWWYQNGEEIYLHFWEGGKPVDHAWDEVDFIVRVAPEWRIEFFSCIGHG